MYPPPPGPVVPPVPPPRRRSRALLITVGVVALVLCGGLCGVGLYLGNYLGSRDGWAGRGSPVTNPNEPEPSPPGSAGPGAIVQGVGGVRTALEAAVIATAGVQRPVSSECDAQTVVPQFTCRITYEHEVVTYRVTTTGRGTGNLYGWQADPDSMIVTRIGLSARMWRTYAMRATEMTCDSDLPEIQRAPVRTVLKQRCYVKPTADDGSLGKNSSNKGRTVAVTFTVYNGNITLSEKRQ